MWSDNESLKNIAPEKMELLKNIMNQSKGRNKSELVPFFLAAASNAGKSGIHFTDSETDLIINALKEGLSSSEQEGIDTIRKLSKLMSK